MLHLGLDLVSSNLIFRGSVGSGVEIAAELVAVVADASPILFGWAQQE